MKMTRFEKSFVNRKRKVAGNIERVRQRLQELNVNNIHEALEIGCGIGLVSVFMAENYGMNVFGTDFDPDEIKIAQKMNSENDNLHFRAEDAANLSFEDNSFDLVVSQNVFHHIPNWEKAVQEIGRVLRPGRYLIWLDIVFPNFLKKVFKPLVKNYGLYTQEEIKSAFNEGGFKTLYFQDSLHGPFKHNEFLLQKN